MCTRNSHIKCMYAGSGKTHTIYGGEGDPGITPRGISELFAILERDGGKYTFSVSCYMLELYQDDLADLLLPQSMVDGQVKARPSCFFPLHLNMCVDRGPPT
jgi:hypothetical protein